MMPECTVLSRVEALGYTLTPAQRERELFGLCLRVTATGMAQYGEMYRPATIAQYVLGDEERVDQVIQTYLTEKGYTRAELLSAGEWHQY